MERTTYVLPISQSSQSSSRPIQLASILCPPHTCYTYVAYSEGVVYAVAEHGKHRKFRCRRIYLSAVSRSRGSNPGQSLSTLQDDSCQYKTGLAPPWLSFRIVILLLTEIDMDDARSKSISSPSEWYSVMSSMARRQ